MTSTDAPRTERPATMQDMDHRDNKSWMYSFAAAMVPFTAFCYGHSRGVTGRVVERVVRSPVGIYGLLALPFFTLAMEKSIYDTVQAWQGIDPNVRPKDRGGFPSGGAGMYHMRVPHHEVQTMHSFSNMFIVFAPCRYLELPSFSLIPVQKVSVFDKVQSKSSE